MGEGHDLTRAANPRGEQERELKKDMEQLPKIVQQRLQATTKAGVHPDSDLLTAFAEKSLNERERAQVLQHLGHCADCRNVVSLAMPELDLAPSTIPSRSPWLAWPVLRWGALAACVVVVSAAVTLHYERRPDLAPAVADKASAPPAPSNLIVESEVSGVPREKLAAKIPPPSPFQPDRDFAGKLAKQREQTPTRSAAAASTFDQLTSNEQAIGAPKANSSINRQMVNNPQAEADLLKSSNKPFQDTGQLANSAPPASPAPTTPEARARNDNNLAQGVTQTVTVQGEPATIVAQSAERKAKDESQRTETGAGATAAISSGDRTADTASAGSITGGYGGRLRAKALPARISATSRWTLSPSGTVQRSLDSGKTWQTLSVANNVVFRAIAANDSDIWAGGSAGALYHSADAGEHWTRVNVLLDGKPLTADIIRVEFSDSLHGRVVTSADETWATSDGGSSWHSE
jgi:Photosynthesis system II assembly factor YCF48/Putative zinc-finger